MLSVTISDLKAFTRLLFSDDAFDQFLLHDANFTTAYTVNVSGILNPEFFEEDENKPEENCVSWGRFRPVATDLIRGKKLPVSFRIVLVTSKKSTEALVKRTGFSGCEVSSLSVNVSYRGKVLTLTTGIAYGGFTLDKSLDRYWDDSVRKFLDSKGIAYEEQA
ncbi:MAG: hypothetical protein J6Z38_02285 [Lachnospiraceae bacterium]|nr:hypothetical protein [Lachnospiraceae bacterium]